MQTNVRPFLKWAGGKKQLLPQLSKMFPSQLGQFDTFVEPFIGGGAVLFYILSSYPNIKNIVINDINSKLIKTYVAVKERTEALITCLEELQQEYWEQDFIGQKQFYLVKRQQFNTMDLNIHEFASLFIFLNKTCFNGLYRVNKKGEFNVPFGQYKRPLICDYNLITKASQMLKNVTIMEGDYTNILTSLQGRSFIYFDPPYRPVSGTSNFTAYNAIKFDESQQIRLASFCKILDDDSKWMLSNSCPDNDDFFRKHYQNFEIRKIKARRSIGAKASSRGNIQELLITNY